MVIPSYNLSVIMRSKILCHTNNWLKNSYRKFTIRLRLCKPVKNGKPVRGEACYEELLKEIGSKKRSAASYCDTPLYLLLLLNLSRSCTFISRWSRLLTFHSFFMIFKLFHVFTKIQVTFLNLAKSFIKFL